MVGKRVRRTCSGTAFLSSDTNSRMRTDVETAALLSAPSMAFWGFWGLVPRSLAVVLFILLPVVFKPAKSIQRD